jgi:ribonuclease P protein component
MNCRLRKINRLRKRKHFRAVFEEGIFVSNPMMAIHLLPNPDSSRCVGFSAGKKLGCAVVRNRCKRRMRECYRQHQNDIPQDMDMVVVARRAMIASTWPQLIKSFREAVQRCRYIVEKKRGVTL